MALLSAKDLRRVAARTWLLQATWNYERQQGLGWAWCLAPVLERLYPDAAARRERLAEHTAYFNTQPTLASLALGAVAQLEEQRAQGSPEPGNGILHVKMVLGSALAALGDRLFWFTLRPVAACLGVLLALGGGWSGALALWLCYNVFHVTLRVRGVALGYREGPAVLGHGMRERLERLMAALAQFGSALVGVVVAVLLVPGGQPQSLTMQMTLVGGLGLGILTARFSRPSPTEYALVLGALCLVAGWMG